MDDPLRVAGKTLKVARVMGLNPYCNGWSSKSYGTCYKFQFGRGLNPYCNGWSSKRPVRLQTSDLAIQS